MNATLVFFASLGGIVLLLGFKAFELKRGIKPFSAYRYKIDSWLERKSDIILSYSEYFNWQTGKLLGIFLVSETKDFVIFLIGKVQSTKLWSIIKGRNIPATPGNPTSSEFLKNMSSLKDEKKDADPSL